MKSINYILFLLLLLSPGVMFSQYVKRVGHQFVLNGKPYYYVGTNYWYGGYLGLQIDEKKGIERLRKELDFLKDKGVNNLRVLTAVEGSGQIHGVQRVNYPLQTSKGVFDEKQLKGLDVLLAEMGKRNMKAVLFLSNNWEWSGGFLQYLNWNGLIEDSVLRRRMNWDEQRDYTSKFYSCQPCIKDYLAQVKLLVARTNSINGKKYADDASIMTWELVNEPRPMRPAANDDYKKWISTTAAYIKSLDKNHLVTLGHEGDMATDLDSNLYKAVHADKNVDYLTIHIWPKNWGWFKTATMDADFPSVKQKTQEYIQRHISYAQQLNKPLVIEEFGLPRDQHSFDVTTTTSLRNDYYQTIFSIWKKSRDNNGIIAGTNFWTFGGKVHPVKGQVHWQQGDAYLGDPPMEEQGLNSVFDTDQSTWNLITSYAKASNNNTSSTTANTADRLATTETKNLFNHLRRLQQKGFMFGHQDATAYGVNWKYIAGKSDVKELVDDYPAVYGWELGNLELSLDHNLDSVPFDTMRELIQQAYQRGGVNTISWHFTNPVSLNNAWDTTHAVQAILPGGYRHELYNQWLDKLSTFLLSLKGSKGEAIPILFRPFHELTGNWFWWCMNTNTPAEFKLLWRYTIDYLRNEKGVHQLLYVYNTAGFNSKEDFVERYPGDDVVDLVSFDAYQGGDPSKGAAFISDTEKKLQILNEVAQEKNKIPALAEAGYEKIPDATWWTNVLLKAIGDHKLSYVLMWRNAGLMPNGNMHYYVPKKGDVSESDFRKFYNDPSTIFQKELSKEKVYSAN
jgi:mannan endo-1,4-beta-mannosidase